MKERGGSETVQCGNLTVTLWQDTRPVLTIATDAQADLAVQVKRKRKDGSMVSINCRESVSNYNMYMGGVDRNDQLHGYYHVRLKSKKYYKYIFWVFV